MFSWNDLLLEGVLQESTLLEGLLQEPILQEDIFRRAGEIFRRSLFSDDQGKFSDGHYFPTDIIFRRSISYQIYIKRRGPCILCFWAHSGGYPSLLSAIEGAIGTLCLRWPGPAAQRRAQRRAHQRGACTRSQTP